MDNEADALRQQMDQTRASLTEKLETLEHQIVETVQGATSAMTETVENVKEAVHDTVSEVKSTVHDTVDSVKSTFDVQHHFNRHPWLMLGGAVAVGYLASRILDRLLETPAVQPFVPPPPPPPPAAYEQALGARSAHEGNGHAREQNAPLQPEPAHKNSGGPTGMFDHEIDQLKKMALGATMGLVRDFVTEQVPAPMRLDVGKILDSVTTKLVGEPVRMD